MERPVAEAAALFATFLAIVAQEAPATDDTGRLYTASGPAIIFKELKGTEFLSDRGGRQSFVRQADLRVPAKKPRPFCCERPARSPLLPQTVYESIRTCSAGRLESTMSVLWRQQPI